MIVDDVSVEDLVVVVDATNKNNLPKKKCLQRKNRCLFSLVLGPLR